MNKEHEKSDRQQDEDRKRMIFEHRDSGGDKSGEETEMETEKETEQRELEGWRE